MTQNGMYKLFIINMNLTEERGMIWDRGQTHNQAYSKRAHQYGVHLNRRQTQCPLQIMKGRRNQDRFILEKLGTLLQTER